RSGCTLVESARSRAGPLERAFSTKLLPHLVPRRRHLFRRLQARRSLPHGPNRGTRSPFQGCVRVGHRSRAFGGGRESSSPNSNGRAGLSVHDLVQFPGKRLYIHGPRKTYTRGLADACDSAWFGQRILICGNGLAADQPVRQLLSKGLTDRHRSKDSPVHGESLEHLILDTSCDAQRHHYGFCGRQIWPHVRNRTDDLDSLALRERTHSRRRTPSNDQELEISLAPSQAWKYAPAEPANAFGIRVVVQHAREHEESSALQVQSDARSFRVEEVKVDTVLHHDRWARGESCKQLRLLLG